MASGNLRPRRLAPLCFTIVQRPETLTASAVKKGLLQRRSPRYIAPSSLGRALDLLHWTEKSTVHSSLSAMARAFEHVASPDSERTDTIGQNHVWRNEMV